MSHKLFSKGTGPLDDQGTGISQSDWPRVVIRYTSVWRPPTDVYERSGKLIVLIEIAGMRDQDFQIVLQDTRLTVSGVRRNVQETGAVAYHQMEIPRGEFKTEVHVPWTIRREDVSAIYRDGLLRIELPKQEAQQIHIVNVSSHEET